MFYRLHAVADLEDAKSTTILAVMLKADNDGRSLSINIGCSGCYYASKNIAKLCAKFFTTKYFSIYFLCNAKKDYFYSTEQVICSGIFFYPKLTAMDYEQFLNLHLCIKQTNPTVSGWVFYSRDYLEQYPVQIGSSWICYN